MLNLSLCLLHCEISVLRAGVIRFEGKSSGPYGGSWNYNSASLSRKSIDLRFPIYLQISSKMNISKGRSVDKDLK